MNVHFSLILIVLRRSSLTNILALVVALTFIGLPTSANAQVAIGGTIASLIQSLQSLASTLTADAQSVIQQGNADLGQQQMLAAGAITALVNQLNDVYKGRLNDTVASVNLTEGNLANDATQILQQAQGIETATASDAHNIVYQMQGSVNQLLKNLPFISHAPAFYGMQVFDVASANPSKGYDLEFLGFNLTDEALKFKHPHIVVGGFDVPDTNVSVQEDRVQVVLPQDIKSKIEFRGNFCDPPSPFSATMTIFYKTNKHILFVPIGKEAQVPFTAFSMPGPDAVLAKVTYSGMQHSADDVTQQFQAVASQVNFGCESSQPGNIAFTAPIGATQINCNASWINTSNVKNHSQSCSVGGNVVTASGSITGLDKQRISFPGGSVANCPGGGHGQLQVTG